VRGCHRGEKIRVVEGGQLVHQQPHAHAAAGRRQQFAQHQLARGIGREDVSLHLDAALRRADGVDARQQGDVGIFQQRQLGGRAAGQLPHR